MDELLGSWLKDCVCPQVEAGHDGRSGSLTVSSAVEDGDEPPNDR